MRVRYAAASKLDAGTLSELTTLIYDAAADSALWSTFLDRFSAVFECPAADLLVQSRESDGLTATLPASVGFDESAVRAYEEHFSLVDPHREPGLEMPSGWVGVSTELVPDEDLLRSEYFHDFYAQAGLRRSLSAMVHNDGGLMTVLAGHYGRDQPAPGPEAVRFLQMLTPHLQRARVLAERLGTLACGQRVLADVLDRLPTGLVFVDARGRFLRANAAGERILREQDGLGIHQGRIVTGDLKSTRILQGILESACKPGTSPPGPSAPTRSSARVPRPSGRRHLDVMVYPVDAESRVWNDELAAAFLLVSDGEAELEGAARNLRELYGLTGIEADLAVAIARGATVKEWADKRGVSVETVRWQLKQVFAKTRTSRQPELIRLVLTGPAFLR
jgi:DNA-binding CsgD family transcriptional regulator